MIAIWVVLLGDTSARWLWRLWAWPLASFNALNVRLNQETRMESELHSCEMFLAWWLSNQWIILLASNALLMLCVGTHTCCCLALMCTCGPLASTTCIWLLTLFMWVINIILLITQSRLYVAKASSSLMSWYASHTTHLYNWSAPSYFLCMYNHFKILLEWIYSLQSSSLHLID